MKASSIILAAALTAIGTALPASGGETPTVPAPTWDWREGAVPAYPIHASCNGTERAQLTRGLDEMAALAAHARDHILRFGRGSPLYARYFGNASMAEPVGWYERLVAGDKAGLLFRCDDLDGNCHQEGWGGYWRGANATSETVICPLSYATRRGLDALCGLGYTVASGALSTYWASDLMHRVFHLGPVSDGALAEQAESHAECLRLAATQPALAVRNPHSLQYFALDTYAYDVALPWEGCSGRDGD